jgi:putative ABC transport system permease protein
MILKLLIRNSLRHKLRSALTVLGIAVAVLAFTLLRTVVGAWSAGASDASVKRLVIRQAVSVIFPLPVVYQEKIKQVAGVEDVTFANWFGGIYKNPDDFENSFPRLAIHSDNYFQIYPEFLIAPDQMKAFQKERNACLIGAETARTHNLKVGDILPIEGDIYPGHWEFVVRGIYRGKNDSTDETLMFFNWKYLDETMQKEDPDRAGQIGYLTARVTDASQTARISSEIDAVFKNSSAETLTETEQAFIKNFVSMYGALFSAMNTISFVIIAIILLVLANTMAMTARERTSEYAVLKTLGFTTKHLGTMIAGESVLIAVIGGLIGLAAGYPLTIGFQRMFSTLFPILPAFQWIALLGFAAALLVGVTSAALPVLRTIRMNIVDGLRHDG